jgi:hypothetical protein
MEYDLYHDESKRGGYWHGMLLVPRSSRELLLDHLASVRVNTRYGNPVVLKGLDKCTGPQYRCIRAWISIGAASLMQNFKGQPCHVYTGRDGRSPGIGTLDNLIGARFILFRVRDDHSTMSGYARMKQGRWFGGFCISECWLENNHWNFSDIGLQNAPHPSLF